MNKKANEQVVSIYWFVILFIVAGSIVFMVSSLYGKPIDVREAEANLLANSIADCIATGGKIQDITDLNNENILEFCKINLNVEDIYDWENDQIYFNISFIGGSIDGKNFEAGNSRFVYACNTGKDNPVCVNKRFFALENEQEVFVEVFTAIRKTEKNA